MSAFPNALFFKAFKTAKMLDAMTLLDEDPPRDIDVTFVVQDTERMNSDSRSRDYEIEYQFADAPDLVEGANVMVRGAAYKLRADPFIPENRKVPDEGNDPYWRHAILSPA